MTATKPAPIRRLIDAAVTLSVLFGLAMNAQAVAQALALPQHFV